MTTSVLAVKVVSYPGPEAWEELLIDFHLLEQQEVASLGQKDQEVLDPACHLLSPQVSSPGRTLCLAVTICFGTLNCQGIASLFDLLPLAISAVIHLHSAVLPSL